MTRARWILLGLLAVVLVAGIGGYAWYASRPASVKAVLQTVLTLRSGTPQQVADAVDLPRLAQGLVADAQRHLERTTARPGALEPLGRRTAAAFAPLQPAALAEALSLQLTTGLFDPRRAGMSLETWADVRRAFREARVRNGLKFGGVEERAQAGNDAQVALLFSAKGREAPIALVLVLRNDGDRWQVIGIKDPYPTLDALDGM